MRRLGGAPRGLGEERRRSDHRPLVSQLEFSLAALPSPFPYGSRPETREPEARHPQALARLRRGSCRTRELLRVSQAPNPRLPPSVLPTGPGSCLGPDLANLGAGARVPALSNSTLWREFPGGAGARGLGRCGRGGKDSGRAERWPERLDRCSIPARPGRLFLLLALLCLSPCAPSTRSWARPS